MVRGRYVHNQPLGLLLRHLDGGITDVVETLPTTNPEVPFPAFTVCPTYQSAYKASKLRVMS